MMWINVVSRKYNPRIVLLVYSRYNIYQYRVDTNYTQPLHQQDVKRHLRCTQPKTKPCHGDQTPATTLYTIKGVLQKQRLQEGNNAQALSLLDR
jgi:hypothetical protein